MKILRVNMNDLTTTFESLPDADMIIGGRALTAKILIKEVPPKADPLGPEAKLIIACGPLAGTKAPSAGRFSIGGKSPLTMGIKEANSGGPAGQKLDILGIRAIIVEGQASNGKLYRLDISKDGAELQDAESLRGLKNYSLVSTLKEQVDGKAAVISIGIAGEKGWKSSAVTMTDIDGHSSRHAARGGLGAVMGSRGLKCIVIDDKGASKAEIADKPAFQAIVKRWAKVIKEDANLQGTMKQGTTAIISTLRFLGAMPALNFSAENLEGVEKISGDAIEQLNQSRGGKMAGCMPGCLVRCSIVYNDEKGDHITSSYEYETIALMGTNLGLVDPDVVAKLDYLADDIGLDTIELGAAMGVAASAGMMKMGDAASALALLDEIEKETKLGLMLANGVEETARKLGIDRIPAYKGQAVPAHDPRITKPTGVSFSTSPMGADHTAGLSYDDFSNKDGQIDRSLASQVFSAVRDATGYCLLATPADDKVLLAFLKDLINARYSLNISETDLIEIGKETLKNELAFNKGSEFYSVHEPDPEFMRNEPIGPNSTVFDVDPAEIQTLWDKLDSYTLEN
ncbi:MAG: aldehyde ferredoxin oxidoreductase [Deltaproteobacteria bacterium]|jgi:aldehyde:ferredoxin oxidoreductase|nr:aldehyde ferredoxin oxidoreductase [Deltaproteobacteria bacterium]MBT4644239.1 aldehyde ferredoxin oxidoreductase [Deltaproteobacteria bacterium]MBT7715902.1 aldehyde ferredoxin oxidoreductase [Deltaproteobacteria bacterium]